MNPTKPTLATPPAPPVLHPAAVAPPAVHTTPPPASPVAAVPPPAAPAPKKKGRPPAPVHTAPPPASPPAPPVVHSVPKVETHPLTDEQKRIKELEDTVQQLKTALHGHHEDQARAQAKLEEMQAWASMPAHVRTQHVLDQKYPQAQGDNLYRVALIENPQLNVWAHSEHEATGRYFEICGVLHSDHKPTVTLLQQA